MLEHVSFNSTKISLEKWTKIWLLYRTHLKSFIQIHVLVVHGLFNYTMPHIILPKLPENKNNQPEKNHLGKLNPLGYLHLHRLQMFLCDAQQQASVAKWLGTMYTILAFLNVIGLKPGSVT